MKMIKITLSVITLIIVFILGNLQGLQNSEVNYVNTTKAIEILTSEYNRGFISGKYEILAELYKCDKVDNQAVTDNYSNMFRIAQEQGIETYFNCSVED